MKTLKKNVKLIETESGIVVKGHRVEEKVEITYISVCVCVSCSVMSDSLQLHGL